MAIKSFITLAPGLNDIKLFSPSLKTQKKARAFVSGKPFQAGISL
jgi:hypothetical protein